MKSDDFVRNLHHHAGRAALDSLLANLTAPPGRRPSEELIQDSQWFNALDAKEKAMVIRLAARAIDYAIVGVLCVLDGSRAIEITTEKTSFKVTASKAGKDVVISDGSMPIHELYEPLRQNL